MISYGWAVWVWGFLTLAFIVAFWVAVIGAAVRILFPRRRSRDHLRSVD
jgi:hypothetical protein